MNLITMNIAPFMPRSSPVYVTDDGDIYVNGRGLDIEWECIDRLSLEVVIDIRLIGEDNA